MLAIEVPPIWRAANGSDGSRHVPTTSLDTSQNDAAFPNLAFDDRKAEASTVRRVENFLQSSGKLGRQFWQPGCIDQADVDQVAHMRPIFVAIRHQFHQRSEERRVGK